MHQIGSFPPSSRSVTPLCPLPTVEDLYIEARLSELVWGNDAIDNSLCLELLLSLNAVKNLFLHKEFVPGIASALVEGRITEVLPGCKIFSWKCSSYWWTFKKNLGSSLLHGSSPVTLSLFPSGTDSAHFRQRNILLIHRIITSWRMPKIFFWRLNIPQ